MVEVTCPCGTLFNTKPSLIKRGGGKYCGRPCTHKYAAAKRPSGLKYDIKVHSSAWIKPGERLSPAYADRATTNTIENIVGQL